jgi:hypothetical protein
MAGVVVNSSALFAWSTLFVTVSVVLAADPVRATVPLVATALVGNLRSTADGVAVSALLVPRCHGERLLQERPAAE